MVQDQPRRLYRLYTDKTAVGGRCPLLYHTPKTKENQVFIVTLVKKPPLEAVESKTSAFIEWDHSPSMTASIKMPTMMIPINRYCFFVSFSFRKILESKRDTTHTEERMGAAMAPFPLMAYT